MHLLARRHPVRKGSNKQRLTSLPSRQHFELWHTIAGRVAYAERTSAFAAGKTDAPAYVPVAAGPNHQPILKLRAVSALAGPSTNPARLLTARLRRFTPVPSRDPIRSALAASGSYRKANGRGGSDLIAPAGTRRGARTVDVPAGTAAARSGWTAAGHNRKARAPGFPRARGLAGALPGLQWQGWERDWTLGRDGLAAKVPPKGGML